MRFIESQKSIILGSRNLVLDVYFIIDPNECLREWLTRCVCIPYLVLHSDRTCPISYSLRTYGFEQIVLDQFSGMATGCLQCQYVVDDIRDITQPYRSEESRVGKECGTLMSM